MPRVQLRDIVTAEDRTTVLGLRRAPGQDEYLNSMPEIFDEADEEQRAMPEESLEDFIRRPFITEPTHAQTAPL